MDYIVKAYKDWKLHSQFQEIVPDMDDAEFMFNEKQSIRDSARTLKKYGSTCCNNMRNNETLIRHEVEKTDTLQGIALKYGCTTEQIRRANRLFASDSLFLRQFLMVPVEKTSPYYPQVGGGGGGDLNGSATADALAEALATPPTTPDANVQRESANNANNLSQTNTHSSSTSSCNTSSHSSSSSSSSSSSCSQSSSSGGGLPPRSGPMHTRPYSIAGELLVQTGVEDPALMHNQSACTSKQSKSLDSVAAMTPEEENRKCMNDFLNKIDNTISESRKYVERSKDLVNSQSEVDIYINTDVVSRHRNSHLNTSYKNNNNNRPPQHQRQLSTGSGNSDTAQLLNTTQTRRVQNSLKRLEKQQDDFFEL